MALTPLRVFEAREAAQYTGTNSADLNAAVSDFTVVSENAAGLTFNSGGTQYTVAPNGYVAWYQGVVTEVFQNEQDFRETYSVELMTDHVHDLVLTTGPAKPLNGNGNGNGNA